MKALPHNLHKSDQKRRETLKNPSANRFRTSGSFFFFFHCEPFAVTSALFSINVVMLEAHRTVKKKTQKQPLKKDSMADFKIERHTEKHLLVAIRSD